MTARLYEPSGKTPIVGLLVGAIAVGVVAVVSAPIYAYATVYCPIAQLSVLLTLVFGAVLGVVPALAMVHLGKVRSTGVVVLFALGASGLGYVLSWLPWLYATMNRNSTVPLVVMLDPVVFAQMLRNAYEIGTWTIGRGDTPVSGLFLGLIWVIEAGLVLGMGALVGFGAADGGPFCERCEAWCKNVGVLMHLPLESEGMIVSRLMNGDLGVLAEVPAIDPSFRPAVQVVGWRCPSCRETATLHVQRVHVQRDKKGNPIEHRDDLVRHLLVRAADVEWAQAGARAPRPPG